MAAGIEARAAFEKSIPWSATLSKTFGDVLGAKAKVVATMAKMETIWKDFMVVVVVVAVVVVAE